MITVLSSITNANPALLLPLPFPDLVLPVVLDRDGLPARVGLDQGGRSGEGGQGREGWGEREGGWRERHMEDGRPAWRKLVIKWLTALCTGEQDLLINITE